MASVVVALIIYSPRFCCFGLESYGSAPGAVPKNSPFQPVNAGQDGVDKLRQGLLRVTSTTFSVRIGRGVVVRIQKTGQH